MNNENENETGARRITPGTILYVAADAPITITLPRPAAVDVQALELATTEAAATEAEALALLLREYGPLAKWGQNVKDWRGEDWREEEWRGGKIAKGFVVASSPVGRLYLADWPDSPAWVFVAPHHNPDELRDPIAAGFALAAIVAGLARGLEGLHQRLPQKISKARERAELAREVVAKISALRGEG